MFRVISASSRLARSLAPASQKIATLSLSSGPTIPPYEEKFAEPLEERRSRLLYQSRKRGIAENGLLLGSFAHRYLDTFNSEQLALYDRLINLPSNDWDIYYWATGVRETPEEFDNEIMALLKEHTRNENRESRITMPNLKPKTAA